MRGDSSPQEFAAESDNMPDRADESSGPDHSDQFVQAALDSTGSLAKPGCLSLFMVELSCFDGNAKLVPSAAFESMEADQKIRVAILGVSMALSVVAAVAAAYGIVLPLDEIGGVPG